jgi:hypothetical protein
VTDLMSQPANKDTAINLRLVDGSFHVWYPCVERTTYGGLVEMLGNSIRRGSLLRVGDPERYSDLCSVVYVNAAHIASFQKAGGHR